MGIEIIGADQGSERDAADSLRSVLTPLLGSHDLLMIVGAQCLGEEVQDLDLLLLGTFGGGYSFTGAYGECHGKQVRLINLCLIVEVKDHSAEHVRFDSQRVKVSYSRHQGHQAWKDATDQVRRQRLSLISFLQRHNVRPPWIESALWLRNYHDPVPDAAANVMAGTPTAEKFLQLVERVRHPQLGDTGFYIAFAKNEAVSKIRRAAAFFRPTVTPTRLDRRRLEQICKKLIADQKYGTLLVPWIGDYCQKSGHWACTC